MLSSRQARKDRPGSSCYSSRTMSFEKLENRLARISLESVPSPRSEVLFSPHPKIAVEIGCGVGLHPILLAKERPDWKIYGLERTKEKFEKFQRRLWNHPKLQHLLAIHDDGLSWIIHRMPDESIDELYLFYPNPYPKEHQRNKRFHFMPIFSLILKKLKIDGSIYLRSNESWYLDEFMKVATEIWGMELSSKKRVSTGETHFEIKYLEQNQICHELVFIK